MKPQIFPRNYFSSVTVEIRTLLRHLPKDNQLREAAQALLEGYVPEVDSSPALLSILENPPSGRWKNLKALGYWREQTIAVWMLGQQPMSPEQMRSVVQALGTVLRSKQSPKNIMRRCLLLFGGFLASTIATGVLASHGLGYLSGLLPLLGYGCLGSPYIAFIIDERIHRTICMMAAWSLGKLYTLSSIESLVQASLSRKSEIRSSAQESLFRVLPSLTTEHYGQLRAETMKNFCLLLTGGYKLEMINTLQVLEALGKVGDGSVIRTVENLSRRGNDPQIRQTAEAILPILYERQRLAEATSSLLRASEQPIASPELLLRPAMDTADPQPEQLLRAVSAPAQGE